MKGDLEADEGNFDQIEGRRGHVRALLYPVTLSTTPSAPEPGPNLSIGRKWKFRRNMVICVAHKHGVSQRFLADVFDLPCSRICAIVKEFREKYGEG
jgi:hypothetical protein